MIPISLFDDFPTAAFAIDESNKVTLWNKACERMTGILAKDVIGTSDHWRGFYEMPRPCLADVVLGKLHEKDKNLYSVIRPAPFTKDGLQAENWCHTADGYRYLIFEANPIIDNQGRAVGAIETLRDRTALNMAEEALRSQATYLAGLTEIQSLFITGSGKNEVFNEILQKLLELTESEYGFIGEVLTEKDGKPYLKSYAVSDISWDEESRRFYEESMASGLEFRNLDTLFGATIRNDELVIANDPSFDPRSGGLPPGHPALTSFLGLPFRAGGHLVGMAGLANRYQGYDETVASLLTPYASTCGNIIHAYRLDDARKTAEKKFKESTERTRAIVNTSVDGIVATDQNGTIEMFNPAAEEIFKIPSDRILGKNITQLMPPELRPQHEAALKRHQRTGKSTILGKVMEITGLRHGGETFPLEVSINEMRLADGVHYAASMRDITERKQVERIKNEFISMVSHELRTPLTSIIGSLKLILAGVGGALSGQGKSLLDMCLRNSERLLSIINDLLDMEKINRGKMEFVFSLEDPNELIRTAFEENQAYGERFGVSLLCSENIEGVKINCDRLRIVQVLSNLISNAIKFSEKGSEVLLSLGKDGEWVRFSVKDEGKGIPEGLQEKIFEQFTQAHSADNRDKAGTGLGLSISKAIIEKHGGHLGVTSREGEGATFFFDIKVMETPQDSL